MPLIDYITSPPLCGHRIIDAGEIFARIDSENSMVRFLEEPEQFASAAMVDRLDQCIRCSVALSERVAAAEHKVRAHRSPAGWTV